MSEVDLILRRLKMAIRDSGMSLSKISDKTGIPKSTLQRWTSGQIKKIPIDQIVIIAKAIGVSEDWIIGGTSSPDAWQKAFCDSLLRALDNADPDDAVAAGLDLERLHYIIDNNKSISLSEACSIADALGFDISEMVSGKLYMPNTKNNPFGPAPIITDSTVTFPLLGDLAAGYDNIALEDWRGETVEIPVSYLNGHERDEFIVLCVKGDSMYPNYQPGDRVLILRQEDVPASGTVGAVRYDDECATLKIIERRTTPEGDLYIRLKPINPQYPPFDIRGEALAHFSVIGVPKLLIRDIDE